MASPNEFQLKQMQSQMAKGGGVSDHYKNLFGSDFNPNSYTPPTPTPNQAQVNQMNHQVSQSGQVSDYYKNQFNMPSAPSYNYYTPPSTSKGAQDYITSGGFAQDTGRNTNNGYTTHDGRVLDTTGYTAQQTHAATLWDDVTAGKRTADQANAVLAGMGLDRYGNPLPVGVSLLNQNKGGASYTMNAGGSTSPTSPTPGSYDSHRAYIDKTRNGAFSDGSYAQNNIDRYNRGEIGYDALLKDSQRVGYTIPPQQQTNTPEQQNPMGYTTQNQPSYGQLNQNQINQEASYTINKQRSDLATAADKQMAGLRNNAQYANQNIADQRVLEDARFDRAVTPFSGKKGYLERNTLRSREIDDTYSAANLENELNAVQQDLYNFDRLAPDKQRALVNEMTRIERDYGLQVGQLTGNFNGGRTLAGQAQDYAQSPNNPNNRAQIIANQIAQLQLDNAPEQIKASAQLIQQQVAAGELDLETARFNLQQLQDPNSPINQMQNLELQMAQLEAKNLPEQQRLELQKLRKQIADIGKAPYRSPEAVELDKQKVLKIKAEIEQIENPPPAVSDDEILQYLK